MPKIPIILIETGQVSWGWVGNVRCPRQPEYENTKNFFCPVKANCVLAQIFTSAETQKEARQIMSKAELPLCNDKKRFYFLDQPPQPRDPIPQRTEADFVITP